jgi:sigma-B regulation protein RsbU (phosphoserine phosphatase)
MLTRPNPASGVPVYVQLMDQVKRGLETGAFRAGDTLPDVHPLAESLVLNPNVVARAYQALETEGVVTREDGPHLRLRAEPATVARREPTAEMLKHEVRRLTAQVAADAAERAKRNHELETAGEVQRRLLPQAVPAIAGVDCAGHSRPAHGVGGDYYDFIELGDQRLGLALGDVSGKGMPAALLMSALRAYLHGQTIDGHTEPAAVMATLNRLVFDCSSANRFVTFFYAVYDAARRTLDYVNAGHNAPIVVRHTPTGVELIRLDASGVAIGLMPDSAYRANRLQLEPGDLLVVFSDGITEAMDADGHEWSDECLAALVAATPYERSGDVVEHVFVAAETFAGGAPQHDDMTVAVVRIQ